MSVKLRLVVLPVLFVVAFRGAASGQIEFDREPINYSSTPAADPVAKLQERIDAGELKLQFDADHGYLESILTALGVDKSSQMLVFSKTSFQQRLISPRSPRALYFNDDVYVGWVPHGDVLEFSSVDPRQGAIFYTLAQDETDTPTFIRDQGNCLTCHASSRTQGVPGNLVRSVFSSPSGLPHFGSGTFRSTHSSPLRERWGGWFVTGTHGEQRHMGNVFSADRQRPEQLDTEDGANVTDLTSRTRIEQYLTPHSDIVALMVLEHQTEMHNLITRAGYEARMARHYDSVMNQAFERPADHVSDLTRRRIDGVVEDLLQYMLFVDEAKLTAPISGTSQFAAEFAARGPRDEHSRSLRQFDLQRRMFQYPCSYLIYSDAFNALPPAVKERVYRRLWEVLSGQDHSETFAHLSQEDRTAIREILSSTKPDLPEYWQSAK